HGEYRVYGHGARERLFGCGWNRDHEHHAGKCDGAHAGDRNSAFSWGQKESHPFAVHGGIGGAGGRGRVDWHWFGLRRDLACESDDFLSDDHSHVRGDSVAAARYRGGTVFWNLSCDARRQARSHRGPAVGSLRNSLGTTARGKLEAGDGYTAHPQDAQRPNRL